MGHATVGVLGGMGPAAGLHFAQQLIALNTAARQDADHVSFILHSDPQIPSRVDAFLKRTASPVPALVASLRKLEALGADFGVIVCNTAHIHFDEIAAQVRLPLIHMIDNAAQHADGLAPKCAKVVLFATAATVKAGLYRCHFGAAGVEIVTPTDEEQALVTAAIFDPETGIKATGMAASPAARQNLAEAAHRLRARTDARHLILGCTELSFAVSDTNWPGFDVIDPVRLLAQTCLARALHRAPTDTPPPALKLPGMPVLLCPETSSLT